MDNAKNPDLKTLIKRDEMIRFLGQLDAISPIPLSITDNYGIVLYENGFVGDEERTIQLTDKSHPYLIKIDDFQIGVILGHESARVSKAELKESLKYAGEMLTDRLAHELKVDSLASEIINSYQELNLFYDIGRSLSSVLDIKAICQIVLEQAVDIIGPKKAFMMLLDEEKENLVVTESMDIDKHLKGLRIQIEDSIYENVIQDREPLVIEDADKYPHLKGKIDGKNAMFDIPLICVPVCVKNEVFGVISMSEKLSGESFTSVDTKLLSAMASQTGMSLGNAHLYEDQREIFLSIVEALAATVEVKDPGMHGHCRRVADYSVYIGEELGLPGKEINDLKLAGILHDIGKIGIPESILKKSEGLTEEELAQIKSHPAKGAEIIGHIDQMHGIALWIRHHHERYDGKGYPDGLQGEDTPLHSRILAIANAYDNVVSDRDHYPNHSYDAAVTLLQIGSGSQFDPEIVKVFHNMVREEAYEKYVEARRANGQSSMPVLNRFTYYRVDNDITRILARVALGNELSEPEQKKLKELRESVLR